MSAITREEEIVHVRKGDDGSTLTAAERFIEKKYGKDAVYVIDVVTIKGHGGLQKYLVIFDLDSDKAIAASEIEEPDFDNGFAVIALMRSFVHPPLLEPERKTPEEVTALARDIITNVVYFPLDPEDTYTSFMILHFMKWSEWDITKVGGVYEEYAKAGPRSINGLPSFFSARLLHSDDMGPLWDEVRRMHEALHGPQVAEPS